MRKLPNFVALRAFEAAARLQSVTLAADELCLTSSAVSHQIKELEKYLGRSLFVRQNRRIEPNHEALRLLESVSRAFEMIECTCAEVSLAPQTQILAVHSTPSFAVKWLAPRLPDFAQHYPNIALRLSTGPEHLDLIRTKEIDLALSYGSPPDHPGVVTVPLGRELVIPMCSPALLERVATVEQLVQQATLIDSSLSRVTWRDWFDANSMRMPGRPRPLFDRSALAIAAAVEGLGLVFESIRLAERELARGELVEIGRDHFVRIERETHFLSYRTTELNQVKIAAFHQWVLDQTQD